jgi:hypothetical protein
MRRLLDCLILACALAGAAIAAAPAPLDPPALAAAVAAG